MSGTFYTHHSHVPAFEWPWPNFTPREMSCPHTARLMIVSTFMDRLQQLRTTLSHPLIITSAYRAPEYNARISRTGLWGPHTTGRAVDIKIMGAAAHTLLSAATALGFTGIGIKQHGPLEHRYIHLDDLENSTQPEHECPRPRVWTYPSQ